MATAGGACAGCGVALTPATAFMTEAGDLCAQCFARYQNREDARAHVARDRDRNLWLRVVVIALIHAVVWEIGFSYVTRSMLAPWLIKTVLSFASVGLALALALRVRWAYVAALALDGPGTLIMIVLGAACFPAGSGWGTVFLAPFTLGVGFLVWLQRDAFAAERGELDLSVDR